MAAGFWGTNSDHAEHDKQGGLVVGVISRDCLRAPAPSLMPALEQLVCE